MFERIRALITPHHPRSRLLPGLKPGTKYWYAVGSCGVADPAGSLPARFFTQPPIGPSTAFTLLVAADFGVGAEIDGSNLDSSGAVVPPIEVSLRGWDNWPATNTSLRMLAEVLHGGAGMLLVLGDISYARGFGAIWESMAAQLQPLASRVPLMTAPGNHESDWPGFGSAYNTSSLDSGGEAGECPRSDGS